MPGIESVSCNRSFAACFHAMQRLYIFLFLILGTGLWLGAHAPESWADETHCAVFREHTVELVAGDNWLSLHLDPTSNAVKDVMGPAHLEGSPVMMLAPRITWRGRDVGGEGTNLVWLSIHAGWLFEDGTPADDYRMPVDECFMLSLPPETPTAHVTLVECYPAALLESGALLQPITGGGAYTIVARNEPGAVLLMESGLREAGFTGAPEGEEVNPNNSDELRVMPRGDALTAPKARILMDGQGTFVFWSGGPFLESAELFELNGRDTFVIHTTRSRSNLLWRLPWSAPVGD